MRRWISLLVLFWPLTLQANDTAFKKTKNAVANMGPGCNIALKIPATAQFSISYSKHSGKGGGGLMVEKTFDLNTKEYIDLFYIGFICYPADEEVVNQGWATFNDSTKEWQINLSEHDAEMFFNAHQTYQLRAVNAEGWVVTINDVTGNEEGRQRHLHYCLIRDSKALCGHGEMGYVENGEKSDLTPYALEILRSIEFLEDVPASSGKS